MSGLAPASMHRGGATAGSLGEREAQLRELFNSNNKDAMATEFPVQKEDGRHPGKPAKIYRIPKIVGFKYGYDIKAQVKSLTGDVISPGSYKEIAFKMAGSGGYGEFVTADPDEQKVVEDILMKESKFVHLGIVEYTALRSKYQDQQAAKTAEELSDPTFLARVVEQAKKLGVKLGISDADGFGEALKGGPGSKPIPPAGK